MVQVTSPINPHKKFAYKVEIYGIDSFKVQKVKLPEFGTETAEHGVANIKIKTAGMHNAGDVELSNLWDFGKRNSFAYNWLRLASNPENGRIGIPSEYKKDGYILQLDVDLNRVITKIGIFGCFPKSIDLDEFDSLSSENTMEKLVLSCDRIAYVGI